MVISSVLCKKLKGAGFSFQGKFVKDRVDDPFRAADVDEADHGALFLPTPAGIESAPATKSNV
jgi:hypothetical protein